MLKSIRNSRYYRISIWLALALIIITIYFIIDERGSAMIPFGDSVQYWAAGRLMVSGENPYSPELVSELRIQGGNEYVSPEGAFSMMLYPPWTIPFLLPFGLLNYPLMRLLWFVSHITILVISVNLLWKFYDGPTEKKYLAYLLLITFPPTFFILVIGHITTLHLIGLVGFLYFIQAENRSRRHDFAAGASAVLVLIKPQLLYLFILAMLVWILQNRKWMVLIGGASVILILSLVPLTMNPLVFIQYWETLTSYDVGTWGTPTIGMLLRFFFGLEHEWLQLFPMIIGITWFVFKWRKQGKTWNWLSDLPLLLLVCVVTAPYGWTYDMVVLLIPIIVITSEMSKIRFNWMVGLYFVTYLAISIFTLYLHSFKDDFWFFWYAPFLLIWYLAGKWLISRINLHSTEVHAILNIKK